MTKVSIITPCYNSEAFIGRTIEGVLAQTFTDGEHIVVNVRRRADAIDGYLIRSY